MTIPVVLFWMLVVLAIPGVVFALLSLVSMVALVGLYYQEMKDLKKDLF